MAATLREHHPDAALTVLLMDGEADRPQGMREARLLTPLSLLGEDAWGLLAAANPPGALRIAVLAHLIKHLLDSGERTVLYVDAGQRVLAPLADLERALDEHDVVLVARAAEPGVVVAPAEASVYSERLLAMRAAGAADALLAEWPQYFDAGAQAGAGAVRAWLDSIPARAEGVGVLRDPGYVLDPLSPAVESLASVRVLDVAALDPADPASWMSGRAEARAGGMPALSQLLERHAADLRAAGMASAAEEQAPFAHLHDGLALTDTIRSLILRGIQEGRLTRSPFAPAGREELYGYLDEPDGRGRAAGLTRLHMAIWERRPDLRDGYPHIDGPDGAGLAGWLCAHGGEQEGLVPALLPPAPELSYRDANPHVHEAEPRLGVNVVGFFSGELGVGEAARLLVRGLDAVSIPALPIQGQLMPPSRRQAAFEHAGIDDAAYAINILCINGDGVPLFAREAGRSFFDRRYTIALWWWEVGDPPAEWSRAYEFVDEVWVASRHIYDALAPSSPVPVVRIALPVVEPPLAARTRGELGLPDDGFLFLYVHDYHSVAARKNPLGLVEAFKRAFPPGAARLVIKSINADTRPREHERVALAAAGREDVTLIDAYVPAQEKNAMIAACDCYVSLHRAEGFGLTVAEAMLLGKPVIATRYGGTMEFTDEENAYLVGWTPSAVGDEAYPYAPDARWAEPDLDHAASLMREVHADPARARERARRARRDVLERHSPQRTGETMARRLEVIRARLLEGGARTLRLTHVPSADRPQEIDGLIGSSPTIDWGSGRLARLRWRALRRVAVWSRAYVEHQSKIDAEMHKAIARVDERLIEVARTLHEQQNAHHAETLAALRGSTGAAPATEAAQRHAEAPQEGRAQLSEGEG